MFCVKLLQQRCLWHILSVLFCNKSNEVGGSHNMEKEGLKRSLELLESKGVAIEYIVTDRHPQIQKFLRERSTQHFYDVWHFEKGKTCLCVIFNSKYNLINNCIVKILPKL